MSKNSCDLTNEIFTKNIFRYFICENKYVYETLCSDLFLHLFKNIFIKDAYIEIIYLDITTCIY